MPFSCAFHYCKREICPCKCLRLWLPIISLSLTECIVFLVLNVLHLSIVMSLLFFNSTLHRMSKWACRFESTQVIFGSCVCVCVVLPMPMYFRTRGWEVAIWSKRKVQIQWLRELFFIAAERSLFNNFLALGLWVWCEATSVNQRAKEKS